MLFYPCKLEPSCYTPLGMSSCTTKALRMKPPIPQSSLVTTQLSVDPTPSQACSQECLALSTVTPQQTDPRSTRAPPPSLAWHPRTLQQQGERAAGLQTSNT